MQFDNNIPELTRRQIEHIAEVCERRKPLVVINCMTYNHEAFLRDALEGFVMQKTDFPFVAVVHDDASTDGTAAILREYAERYPDIILPLYEEDNQYSKHTLSRVMRAAKIATGAKYVAMCEGDDYWIDPMKLQKQVDFLETNPDYSMCFHRAKILTEGGIGTSLRCEDVANREYDPNELLKNWKVPTASIVASKKYLYVKNIGMERILNGDIIMVLNCAKIGKIRGMSEVMSAYRVHQAGVTYDECRKKGRCMKYPDHFRFIKDNYPFLKHSMINHMIAHAYMERSEIQPSVISRIKDIIAAYYYCPGYLKLALLRLLNKLHK